MKRKLFDTACFIGGGIPFCALRFADGGGSGTDTDDKPDNTDGKDKPGTGEKGGDEPNQQEEEKKFTQSDIDDAVEKRLAREKRRWEREHPEVKKDGKGGKPDPDKKTDTPDTDAVKQQAEKQIAAANRKLVQAEAKAVALSLGVKPERVGYAVRMADLGKVDVDDELGADTGAIKKAMDQVLKDIPELKGSQTDSKNAPGFKIGGDGDGNGKNKGGKNTDASYRDAIAAHYKK